jgi:hypothetical protein
MRACIEKGRSVQWSIDSQSIRNYNEFLVKNRHSIHNYLDRPWLIVMQINLSIRSIDWRIGQKGTRLMGRDETDKIVVKTRFTGRISVECVGGRHEEECYAIGRYDCD